MPGSSWKNRWSILLGAALVAGVAGFLTGQWLASLSGVLLAALGWQVFNAWKLHEWLTDRAEKLPRSLGAWAVIFREVTSLKNSRAVQKEQLQEIIREFQSVTDALPDATIVIDEHDVITWFNDSASKLLHLRKPKDIGQPVTNLLREPDFANWIAIQEGLESKLEMSCPHHEQIRLSANAVRFREGQRLLIFSDITEIHNLEQVRKDFVANVSHELRTPLTVLLGYLEALADQCPESLQAITASMQGQASQMQALLDDLLRLSQLQTHDHQGEEEVVDVPAMLMMLKEQAEELSQGNHVLQFEVQPGLKIKGITPRVQKPHPQRHPLHAGARLGHRALGAGRKQAGTVRQ
jgi:two-component system phosphate regulon sensor histidine kinase PhoR